MRMRGRVRSNRVEDTFNEEQPSKMIFEKPSWNDNHSKTVFAKPLSNGSFEDKNRLR